MFLISLENTLGLSLSLFEVVKGPLWENCKVKSVKVKEQLAQEVANLRKALVYSELRNEALTEVLKIGREQYGIDLLKKVGAKQ